MKSRDKFKLLVATKNAGKADELRSLLGTVPNLQIHSLLEFPNVESVEETDSSYVDNAVRKASFYSTNTEMCAIADDSGLEVDALDGGPGVLSARFGGPGATDVDRVRLLLNRLVTVKASQRQARFRSVVAVANHDGKIIHAAEGVCEGVIAYEPRGDNGFGYDPIFIPLGYDRTFAELSIAEKDAISHRGVAFRTTRDFLLRYLSQLDRSECAS